MNKLHWLSLIALSFGMFLAFFRIEMGHKDLIGMCVDMILMVITARVWKELYNECKTTKIS